MSTLNILTERIRKALSGGFPSTHDRVDDAEIRHAIVGMASKLLKADYYSGTVKDEGETIVDAVMIASYDNIPVKRGNGLTAIVDLPAMPMTLPDRQGVFEIYPSGEPENFFYSMPPGIINSWLKDQLVSPLGRGWYVWMGNTVTIYADLIGAGKGEVDMKLCVKDLNNIGLDDPLPLPPDMVMDIIATIVSMYNGEPKTERKEGIKASPETTTV